MSHFQSTLWTLISEARRGDERATSTFGQRYRPPVIAYCRRLGLSIEAAEDAAQEVLLRFFCRGIIQRVDRRKGRFRSLLSAVTRNVVRQHWERQAAGKRAAATRSLRDLDLPETVPDEIFDREWIRHLIERSLSRLENGYPQYYDVLSRFLLEESSYTEIALQIGISETTVKNHVYRGKQKLIEIIRDEVRDYCISWDQYAAELEYLAGVMGTTRAELQQSALAAAV
jgi:RNA polymerase sigma factor (sigma-70 family)